MKDVPPGFTHGGSYPDGLPIGNPTQEDDLDVLTYLERFKTPGKPWQLINWNYIGFDSTDNQTVALVWHDGTIWLLTIDPSDDHNFHVFGHRIRMPDGLIPPTVEDCLFFTAVYSMNDDHLDDES